MPCEDDQQASQGQCFWHQGTLLGLPALSFSVHVAGPFWVACIYCQRKSDCSLAVLSVVLGSISSYAMSGLAVRRLYGPQDERLSVSAAVGGGGALYSFPPRPELNWKVTLTTRLQGSMLPRPVRLSRPTSPLRPRLPFSARCRTHREGKVSPSCLGAIISR
jgi:hypothetical protein